MLMKTFIFTGKVAKADRHTGVYMTSSYLQAFLQASQQLYKLFNKML